MTTYSKIVRIKKLFFPKRLIPIKLAKTIDDFFNNFHNSLIQAKDLTRDSFIRTKDLTRDSIIQAKDLTRDSFIRTKDLTRDSIIQAKDLTRDSFIRTKDLTRDSIIQAKDLTRDSVIQTKDTLYDNLLRTKNNLSDVIKVIETEKNDSRIRNSRIYLFLKNFFRRIINYHIIFYNLILNLFEIISLSKYGIDVDIDQNAVRNIKKIISNSKNVQQRVLKYYNRDSDVIYPPIDIENSSFISNGDFWLSVNRITPAKRVLMQVNAFNQMPNKKLVIVGSYNQINSNYINSIKKIASNNIIFLNNLEDIDLIKLYANCKGFITTAKDEDFGMTVVEAMASGKPVIAPNEGGYKESIIDGENGILIDDINEKKIISSVNNIESTLNAKPDIYITKSRKQSEKFSTDTFIKEIKVHTTNKKRVVIFHDYFKILGGAEKLVLTLAKSINADIITSEFDNNFILDEKFSNLKIITLGKTSKNLNMLPNICRKRFEECDFSKDYDFYIFSGTFSIYAAKKHEDNLWYCHTPLRGLYDLKNEKHLQ